MHFRSCFVQATLYRRTRPRYRSDTSAIDSDMPGFHLHMVYGRVQGYQGTIILESSPSHRLVDYRV